METGPLVATPNRSSGIPSASTIVARTVMVPSLAMAALWIFTTTPVFPREVVLPFSWATTAVKSTGRLAGWWPSADAVLNKTTGARTSRALARCVLMDQLLNLDQGNTICRSHIHEQIVVQSQFRDGPGPAASGKNQQWLRNFLHMRRIWERTDTRRR